MEKKEIKEQRMREYFISAAREILQGEGMSALNVRAVAERAGYSYATLYNYFSDLKDLVFECIAAFITECDQLLRDKMEGKSRGFERIKAAHRSYVDYFVQYPGIFDIFYIEKMSDFPGRKKTGIVIRSFHRDLASEDWDFCVSSGLVTSEAAEGMKDRLVIQIAGILLYYLNRNDPASYKEFSATVDTMLGDILRV